MHGSHGLPRRRAVRPTEFALMSTADAEHRPLAHFLPGLGIHSSTCTRWITRGVLLPDGRRMTLPALRVGGRWMARPGDVAAFVDRLTRAHLPGGS